MRIEGAMIPERIRRVRSEALVSFRLVSGFFSRAVRAVGRDSSAGKHPCATFSVGDGPPFSNQHVGVSRRKFQSITDGRIAKVNAIDHFRIFPDEADWPCLVGWFGPAFGTGRVGMASWFPWVAARHVGSNLLKASGMPIVDGTNCRDGILIGVRMSPDSRSTVSTNIAMCS